MQAVALRQSVTVIWRSSHQLLSTPTLPMMSVIDSPSMRTISSPSEKEEPISISQDGLIWPQAAGQAVLPLLLSREHHLLLRQITADHQVAAHVQFRSAIRLVAATESQHRARAQLAARHLRRYEPGHTGITPAPLPTHSTAR